MPSRFDTGRLTLRSSSSRRCLFIRGRFDTAVENTEEFFVGLLSTGPLPPFVELARTSAVVFILDNDSMLQLLLGYNVSLRLRDKIWARKAWVRG